VKIARTVLLICAMLGSLVLPIFFLAIRHFHLESETANWLVSMWPRSQASVALEDRSAAANMLVTYGELAGASMLTYTVIGWCAMFVFSRVSSRRGTKAKDPGFPD
jgi:hypothetical protein